MECSSRGCGAIYLDSTNEHDARVPAHPLFCGLQAVLWRYKFSQLKGSSDDGKSKIKFLFQNQDTKLIEAKVMHFFLSEPFFSSCMKIPPTEKI